MQLRELLLRLGGAPGEGAEVNLECFKCPDSDQDGKLKLGVNTETGMFNCFRCGYSGVLGKLLRDLTKMRLLSGDVGSFTLAPADDRPKIVRQSCALPPGSMKLWEVSPPSIMPRAYMESRGVPSEEFEERQLHFCLSGNYGFRVIIPTIMDNTIVNWTARSYVGAEMRYLNPRNEDVAIEKHLCLYGWDTAKKYSRIIVLEGALNAMVVGRDACAGMGKCFSTEQIQMLLDARPAEYIVGLDYDAMATRQQRDDSPRGFRLVNGEGLALANKLASAGRRVGVVLWPANPKKDPADLGRGHSRMRLDRPLPWCPAVEAYLRMLRA